MTNAQTDEDELRIEIHDWFERIEPEVRSDSASRHRVSEEEDFAQRRRFALAMARDGWSGLAWPTEWGGAGSGYRERLIFAQEAAKVDAPDPLNRLAVDILGPTIAVLGSAEQRERYLPPILAGETVWCQGFSEPGAGSDLASLATRAERDGDGWRISGQKVWTSFGQYADWCAVLARTDPDAGPHKGISAFVVPMDAPGLTVRPIRQITGGSDFCELFLDGVFVTDDDLIGGAGGGWRFAMTALGFERSINFMTRQVRLSRQIDNLVTRVRDHGPDVPSSLKDRLLVIFARAAALQAIVEAQMAELDHGGEPGVDANAAKVFWSETFQALADLGAELEMSVPGFRSPDYPDWSQTYLISRSTTIYAGTSEIQRNIIAERGLGLPR